MTTKGTALVWRTSEVP